MVNKKSNVESTEQANFLGDISALLTHTNDLSQVKLTNGQRLYLCDPAERYFYRINTQKEDISRRYIQIFKNGLMIISCSTLMMGLKNRSGLMPNRHVYELSLISEL